MGNPGREYEATRHNLGFWVVDQLAHMLNASGRRRWMGSEVARGFIDRQATLLVKPQTFMNLSGDAVQPLVRYHRAGPEDLLVIYDDLDLPEGTLRIRPAGGAGGHRGMQSLITSLGSDKFARIRMGIGRPPSPMTSAEYVLQPLTKSARRKFDPSIKAAAEAAILWVNAGVTEAMNKYNGAMP